MTAIREVDPAAATARQANKVTSEFEADIDEIVSHYPVSKRSASLPLLHYWQNHFGHVDDSGIEWIAARLDLQPINIYELVTFYPWFRREAAGKTIIRVCRTLACAMAGSYAVKERFCAAVGLDPRTEHHGYGSAPPTTPDGRFSVEFVECLASCDSAPVALINDDLHERISPDAVPGILERSMKPFVMPPPHSKERRIIFENISKPGYDTTIETCLAHGGYESLRKAVTMKPAEIVDAVKASNLRGRGGAGFPCGAKWGFIKHDDGKPHYIVVNADESEPGTFKDRYILHFDPHQLIEGLVISAYATNTHLCYIYIRCEFPRAAHIVWNAIKEARAKGFVGKNVLNSGFDVEIYVHQGAGAYICGEETSLLESLEGKRPYPRIKPPYFPAILGLYLKPTIVNNVETICHVKHILRLGGAEYAKMGTPGDGGTRILCVSGDVMKPGFYEMPAGAVTLGELIHDVCGGLRPGRKLKAVIPGGSSAKVMRADEIYKVKVKDAAGKMVDKEINMLDVVMDAASLAAAGTMIGSGGVMVMDDSREMVWALNNLNQFYAHESCGQCTPCREGSLWMSKITSRMLDGEGVAGDPKVLKNVADNIAGRTVCAFGEACSWPTQSFLAKFPEEFDAAASEGRLAREATKPKR
ncbi:MAG: NAD(P)H-dependent oxidoreductase subunit E [Terrimicrobiaceae bacterium]